MNINKRIKLALSTALVLGATSSFATNGDNMIGLAVESRAMGSVGIAKSYGAGSGLANGALLSSVKDKEITGTVTFFMPDVAVKSNGLGSTGVKTDSDADFSAIPEMYYAQRLSDKLVYGIVIAGTAGMGTDYSDTTAPAVNRMKTNLMLMKIAMPVSYQMDKVSIGLTPIIQYGKLLLDHDYGMGGVNHLSNESSDTGLGFEIGVTYEVSSSLSIGSIYKSEISMEYQGVMSESITSFGGAAATGVSSGDRLDQPAEYGVGISYVIGGNTIAADVKRIEWGSATGYSNFGWEDQNVYSLGYEYDAGKWALRAGYNYSDSPIKEQNGATYSGAVKNFFNLAGFPGIVETHYTLGGGYEYSDSLSYDIAMIYADKVENSFSTAGMGVTGSTVDVTHSQFGVTIGATYKF